MSQRRKQKRKLRKKYRRDMKRVYICYGYDYSIISSTMGDVMQIVKTYLKTLDIKINQYQNNHIVLFSTYNDDMLYHFYKKHSDE